MSGPISGCADATPTPVVNDNARPANATTSLVDDSFTIFVHLPPPPAGRRRHPSSKVPSLVDASRSRQRSRRLSRRRLRRRSCARCQCASRGSVCCALPGGGLAVEALSPRQAQRRPGCRPVSFEQLGPVICLGVSWVSHLAPALCGVVGRGAPWLAPRFSKSRPELPDLAHILARCPMGGPKNWV